MLIVEGPDGAGKTSLIRDLLHHTNLELMSRAVSSEQGPITDLAEWTEKQLGIGPERHLLVTRGRLYDRFTLISEPIYGSLLRRTMPDGFDNHEWLAMAWAHLLSHKPTFVFCLPPLRVVRGNVQLTSTPQMKGVVENIDRIYWQYHCLAGMLRGGGYRVIQYNYTEHYESQLAYILELVRASEE